MPANEQNTRTLSQLTAYIDKLVTDNLGGRRFWLKAEISQISSSRNGHWYIDFVEHQQGKLVSRIRANVWKYNLESIKAELGAEFHNVLAQGKEILSEVTVHFDAVYGLSLQVHAVDLNFSIGELERRKKETIARLTREELLGRNRQIPLPTIVQRIAVISSQHASGYEDFVKQLRKNDYRFHFEITLFQASVQGVKAVPEIIRQLRQLEHSDYHAIAILRGGGSKMDLETFNDYELAKTIALHSKPILTGIGHETDVSVADMVAHAAFKTPSALGSHLVERMLNFYNGLITTHQSIINLYQRTLQGLKDQQRYTTEAIRSRAISYTQLRRGKLHQQANRIINKSKQTLASRSQWVALRMDIVSYRPFEMLRKRENENDLFARKTFNYFERLIKQEKSTLVQQSHRIHSGSLRVVERQKDRLVSQTILLRQAHPDVVLKRGFGIVRKSDHVVTKLTSLKEGDLLEIELYQRKLYAQYLNDEPQWKNLKELLTKKPQKS